MTVSVGPLRAMEELTRSRVWTGVVRLSEEGWLGSKAPRQLHETVKAAEDQVRGGGQQRLRGPDKQPPDGRRPSEHTFLRWGWVVPLHVRVGHHSRRAASP